MRSAEWSKNFAFGTELDVAEAFIYNGIKTLRELDFLDQAVGSVPSSGVNHARLL